MAFSTNYMSKVSASQTFDKSYNPSSGIVGANLPTIWLYNASATGSNEALATVTAANYFLNFYASLNVGDAIYIVANDPTAGFRRVATSTSGGVTVAALG